MTSWPASTGSLATAVPVASASSGKKVLALLKLYWEYFCQTSPDCTRNAVLRASVLPVSVSVKRPATMKLPSGNWRFCDGSASIVAVSCTTR